jgi:saccharopine dehydrogenase-like NADP-dependent oxidoreductase
MKLLLNDLGLRQRRDILKDILETNIPETAQDVVVTFVTVSGQQNGRLMQETYAHKVYAGEVRGIPMSAIQATTACSVCAVLDLLAEGVVAQKGYVRQEEIALDAFLGNRFGRVYARTAELAPAVRTPKVAV